MVREIPEFTVLLGKDEELRLGRLARVGDRAPISEEWEVDVLMMKGGVSPVYAACYSP
jgi:hypothetical protein